MDGKLIEQIISGRDYNVKHAERRARREGFSDGFLACISALKKQNPGMVIDTDKLLNELTELLNK